MNIEPEEALVLLDQTVAQISGSRQFHVQLQQAIECLRNAITEPSVATDGAADRNRS